MVSWTQSQWINDNDNCLAETKLKVVRQLTLALTLSYYYALWIMNDALLLILQATDGDDIYSIFSVVCDGFVRWFVTILFGDLWRFCSVICGEFIRWFVIYPIKLHYSSAIFLKFCTTLVQFQIKKGDGGHRTTVNALNQWDIHEVSPYLRIFTNDSWGGILFELRS